MYIYMCMCVYVYAHVCIYTVASADEVQEIGEPK